MTKIAVVILNYNGVGYLKQFLPGIIRNSLPDAEVIVADNASTDSSVALIKTEFKDIRLIQLNKNHGFAGGYNEALKQVDSGYYVLLNSDVEVTENWIKPVIEVLESDQKIAACQPKIKSYGNRKFFEHAGAAGGFIDKFGYPFCRGRIFDKVEKDEGQYDDISEVFWASGACMFIKSKEFHEAGGFDADYFAHMEEIDLCWRLKNNGYKIMYCPGSTVYHVGGGTLHKSSPRKTYLNFRNSLFTLLKNHPSKGIRFKIMTRLMLDALAGIKFLFDGHFMDTVAIIRAHFSFYGSYLKVKQKRVKDIHNLPDQVLDKSIVFEHYVRGKKYFNELN